MTYTEQKLELPIFMNLKVKKSPFSGKVLLTAVLVSCFWLVFFFVVLLLNKRKEVTSSTPDLPYHEEVNQLETTAIRRHTFEELSPDNQKKVTRYETSYQQELFSGNYTTYLDNKVIIAITNNSGDAEREYYVFTGEERTGDPHWLGNQYVFFTTYCGTACQKLILLDVHSRQIREAMISYWSKENNKQKTYFNTWFDQGYEFFGLVDRVYAQMIENRPYLIFDISNDYGVESGQKKFLFTGESLILQ